MVLEVVEEKGERTDGAAVVKRGTALVDGVLPALPRSPVDCVEVLEVLEVVDTEDATSSSEDVRKEEAADAVPDAGDVLARAEKSYAEERADLQCMHVAT